MSKQNSSGPNRPLSVNFTKKTLQRSITTKRRNDRVVALRGLLGMKQLFWKQPAGALLAVALVITGGVGVYAATNWFNGSVKIASDDSVMTVDLSQCESNIPPGVGPKSDRKNIQFKITGSPHIEAKELERKLLFNCEFESVLKIYQETFGPAVNIHPAIIKKVDTVHNAITVAIRWGGVDNERTFTLDSKALLRDKGVSVQLDAYREGDSAMVGYMLPADLIVNESETPFDKTTVLNGVFKTQYDTREVIEDAKSLYSKNNIMPLEQYNELNK